MTKHFRKASFLVLIALLALSFAGGESLALNQSAKPKNIIVMIADGWSRNHITSANFYEKGEDQIQIYESFPVSIYMATFLARFNKGDGNDYDVEYNPRKAWSDFEYVKRNPTGSAAAATAMATGKKTYYRSIGIAVDGSTPLENITQRAKSIGKAAGVVTSVQLSHATPAGFVAHIPDRGEYEAITNEMFFESGIDLIIGCGAPDFDDDGKPSSESYKYVGGEKTWNALESGKTQWTLVRDRSEFVKLASGETPEKVLGVPKVHSTLQQKRGGNGSAGPGEVPLIQSVPTLKEITEAALNVLDEDEDGFFLMIEGGAVDWASHDNQSGRMIEEMSDFNRAAEAVVDWVERQSGWSETLLVVTGDHECGYLCGPDSDPERKPIKNNGAGNLPGMEWHSGSHTNQLIPFFAKGAGADIFETLAGKTDPVRGAYIDNSDLGAAMFLLWSE